MVTHPPVRITLVVAALLGLTAGVAAQTLPNPYRLVDEWPNLPSHMNGGRWGETIGVDRDADGNIWVFHRCFNNQPPGAATCVGRDDDPPIVKFSPDGRLLDSWGEGVFAAPHGFHIDPEGNIWATDYNGSDTVLGVPAGGRETIGRSAESGSHYLTGVALDMALEAVAEAPDPGLADGGVEGVEIVFEGAIVEGDVHVLGKTVDDAVDLGE